MASIVLWFVHEYWDPSGFVADVSDSFAAMIGRFLVPFLASAGLGQWQIAVALISGISAKEVVVSSFSVLYGIGNINSAGGMAELAEYPGGRRIYRVKRLCADGVLSALHPVYCDDCDDPQGDRLREVDGGHGRVPAHSGLGGGHGCVPAWQPPVRVN